MVSLSRHLHAQDPKLCGFLPLENESRCHVGLWGIEPGEWVGYAYERVFCLHHWIRCVTFAHRGLLSLLWSSCVRSVQGRRTTSSEAAQVRSFRRTWKLSQSRQVTRTLFPASLASNSKTDSPVQCADEFPLPLARVNRMFTVANSFESWFDPI
jgi:hypothetical protein